MPRGSVTGVAESAARGHGVTQQRVLVADDNEPMRVALRRVLSRAGHAVLEAATGAEALSLVSHDVDLVLLDIHLPDADGREVCRRIKECEATSHVMVVHLTCVATTAADHIVGLEGGADGYLTHPVDPGVLTATVGAMLRIVRAERERHRLEGMLRQSQRLASLGTFACGMAHEINNPLMGAMTYCQILEDDLHGSPRLQEYAQEAGRACARIAQIVRHLQEFASPEAQNPVPCDVREVVNRALAFARTTGAHMGIDIVGDVQDLLPPVLGHPQLIEQALANLIANATEALRDQPDRSGIAKRVVIRAAQAGTPAAPLVRISVEDNGPGIAEDTMAWIFDPFFTTRCRSSSAGLGLAVSHGIAVRHGGSLTVASRPGEGARFDLELPVDTTGEHLLGGGAPEA